MTTLGQITGATSRSPTTRLRCFVSTTKPILDLWSSLVSNSDINIMAIDRSQEPEEPYEEENQNDEPSDEESYVVNYPCPAKCVDASGSNGETETIDYPVQVDWSDAASVSKLNRWKNQRQRRANKRWGTVNLKRPAVIPLTLANTHWLENKFHESPQIDIAKDLLPQFQLQFPNPRTHQQKPNH